MIAVTPVQCSAIVACPTLHTCDIGDRVVASGGQRADR